MILNLFLPVRFNHLLKHLFSVEKRHTLILLLSPSTKVSQALEFTMA